MKQSAIKLIIFILTIILLSCSLIRAPLAINANSPIIGESIDNYGHVVENDTFIAHETEKIYFEYFLDIPEKTVVTVEHRWYYEEKIISAYLGRHPKGYTVATLERDPTLSGGFIPGGYTVEVLFLDVILIQKSFEIK